MNCIAQIEHNSIMYSNHVTKAKVFFDFFKNLMGTAASQTPNIQWSNLYLNKVNLENLTNPITKQQNQASDQLVA